MRFLDISQARPQTVKRAATARSSADVAILGRFNVSLRILREKQTTGFKIMRTFAHGASIGRMVGTTIFKT
jgi:hypothetical protein